MNSPLDILQQYWGHESFRPQQEQIIESVLNGRDTVALLPTGGGKSLCFQIPTLADDGICIVISPLVALMNDQVRSLQQKGIKALAITGGISFTELNTLLDNANYGKYKFLYLSPERLQQELVQNAIKRMDVSLIAVDEAHCISQWGNDFRPAYRNIQIVKEIHPLVPTIALTATATPKVLEDTIAQLKLESPNIFRSSFVRENLSYRVRKENDTLFRLQQLLEGISGSAIVYVRSRARAESVSAQLTNLGISATFFHGGITSEEKKNRLESWKNEEVTTVVATNAFGMGIDHDRVRLVTHIQLPESLESYFQEAGRAGRDGLPAEAIVLYTEDDKRVLKKQFVDSLPGIKDLKKLYRTLATYFQISYGEGEFTNHSFNFTEFCARYQLNTLITYNGLNALDRLGVIQLSKEFGRRSVLKFLASSETLLKEFEKNVSFSMVGKTILRIYGGIFETANPINIDLVARKMGSTSDKVTGILQDMEKQGFIELKLYQTDASITFLVPREDDKTINPLREEVEALEKKKRSQVASVLEYITNETDCKQLQLVRYFGEENDNPCGKCSVCEAQLTAKKKSEVKDVSKKIIKLLAEHPMESKQLIEKLTFAETDVLEAIRLLLDSGEIRLNAVNQYFIK